MAHVNISRYTNDTTWSSGQDGRMSRCHTRVTRSVREEGSKGSEQVLEVVLGGEVNIIHIYMNNCSCMQYLYFKARSLALFGGVRLNLDSGFRAIPGVGACLSQRDSSNDVTLPTAGRALRAVFSSWNALNCMWIPPPPPLGPCQDLAYNCFHFAHGNKRSIELPSSQDQNSLTHWQSRPWENGLEQKITVVNLSTGGLSCCSEHKKRSLGGSKRK